MSRRRKVHVATGTHAQELRRFCRRHHGIDEDDVVFHLAQCLAFLIQGSDASVLAERVQVSRNRFAIRKLRSTIKMLDVVFEADEDVCSP